jgi:polyribonucleotide 5'-hydroxyl-kinase
MKALRQSQIRSYFFGASWDNPLAPQSHMAEFDDLNIYKVINNEASEAANNNNNSFQPGDADESVYRKAGGGDIFEKVVPSSYMTNSLLAITTAAGNDRQEAIRDASVRGYIYVADVDETKKKIRVLSPQPGLTPTNAIILGSFPEDVPSLVG